MNILLYAHTQSSSDVGLLQKKQVHVGTQPSRCGWTEAPVNFPDVINAPGVINALDVINPPDVITSQVRLLAHNALALFVTWITLHTVLTFALFLTFGMDHLLTARSASLVELCVAGFLVFFYVLVDLTICDKYSRSVHW